MASVLSSPSESRVAISATNLLIDNRRVPAESGKTFATVNPATGEKIYRAFQPELPLGPWAELAVG